jgi:hypothetical protein
MTLAHFLSILLAQYTRQEDVVQRARTAQRQLHRSLSVASGNLSSQILSPFFFIVGFFLLHLIDLSHLKYIFIFLNKMNDQT